MSALHLPGPIVSAKWLLQNLPHRDLIVLDATLKPSDEQIPGARVFDIDKRFSDQNSHLPHMMPTPERFTQEAQALGIRRESVIVIYDRVGVYSSPRARWMFKAMGHDKVAVLDGGLPHWLQSGLTTEKRTKSKWRRGNFIARAVPDLFCNKADVENAIMMAISIVDARSAGRFHGFEPEPRAGLKSGHIPYSQNLPFSEVVDGSHLHPIDELKKRFQSLGVTPDKKIIFSCGSGVTACIVALAAELSGFTKISVYDGSWAEWGQSHE